MTSVPILHVSRNLMFKRRIAVISNEDQESLCHCVPLSETFRGSGEGVLSEVRYGSELIGTDKQWISSEPVTDLFQVTAPDTLCISPSAASNRDDFPQPTWPTIMVSLPDRFDEEERRQHSR